MTLSLGQPSLGSDGTYGDLRSRLKTPTVVVGCWLDSCSGAEVPFFDDGISRRCDGRFKKHFPNGCQASGPFRNGTACAV
jgi:hypothetical protein